MNKKGFTLIELIAVILLIAIISLIAIPTVVNNMDRGKKKTYEILVNNIITASKQYYEECENNGIICTITDNKIEIDLIDLVTYGFLTGSNDDSGKKIIVNPINKDDISECSIEIQKIIDSSFGKVTYTIKSTNIGDKCPTDSQYEGNF